MNEELGFTYHELNISYALGCAGVAIGAVLLTPFALKFGRRQIYITSLLLQVGVCIWEAKLQTVPELYLVTFLSCFLGSLAEIMIQMTVADVFFIHQRGAMNSIFIFCQQIGTAVAPVAAGYITTWLGWRAVWWAMTISLATGLLAFVFLYEESKYAFTLLMVVIYSNK
jgi:MFS family permease